jgi:hypothetical protein
MTKRAVEYEIDEKLYRPDLEVLGKYQEFSSEILRLALVLFAGYGFLIKEIVLHTGEHGTFFGRMAATKGLLIIGLVAIGFAVGGSLGHRYFSTDGFEHLIRYLRRAAMAAESNESARAAEVYERMLGWYRIAWWCFRTSVAALAIGAVSVAVAFLSTLFG